MNMLKVLAVLSAILGSGLLYPATSRADHVLTLSPSTALNTTDSIHTVTANLTQSATPVAGVTVYFEVTGVNADTGSAVTDGSGNASFSYSAGIGDDGVDTISACADADADVDGSFAVCAADGDHNPEAVPVSKTWIDEFAKISGNAGPFVKVKGARHFSFQGLVGQFDSTVVGSLAINYRVLRTVCTFTPGSGTFVISGGETIATLAGWTYSCTDGGSGTATIVLTDKTADGPRGSISVDASQDAYDIAPLGNLNLNTGNVHIDDLITL